MNYSLYSISFPNGKKYIGIAKNYKKRWDQHRWCVKKGSRLPVHCAISKYGDATKYRVLCFGDRQYIVDLEVKAIDCFKTRDIKHGYNITVGGDSSRFGLKCTPEHKANISASLAGRSLSDSHKANIKAMVIASGRKPPSSKGRITSDATKAKLSKSGIGKHAQTAEHKAKLSAANKGRKHSIESKEKNRIAHLGKKHSSDTLMKMSIAQKLRYNTGEHKMSKYNDAGLLLKRMAVKYESLMSAAAALEEIGSFEQAATEQKKAADSAKKEADTAKAELARLKIDEADAKQQIAAALSDAQANIARITDKAKNDAEEIVKRAQAKASSIEEAAKSAHAALTSALNTQIDELKAKRDALHIDVSTINDRANAASELAVAAEARLASIRATLAKMSAA